MKYKIYRDVARFCWCVLTFMSSPSGDFILGTVVFVKPAALAKVCEMFRYYENMVTLG